MEQNIKRNINPIVWEYNIRAHSEPQIRLALHQIFISLGEASSESDILKILDSIRNDCPISQKFKHDIKVAMYGEPLSHRVIIALITPLVDVDITLEENLRNIHTNESLTSFKGRYNKLFVTDTIKGIYYSELRRQLGYN